jgi:hypothetical protein
MEGEATGRKKARRFAGPWGAAWRSPGGERFVGREANRRQVGGQREVMRGRRRARRYTVCCRS